MESYYKTYEETNKAANQAKKDNYDTFLEKGIFQCDCGESFCLRLYDMNSLNLIEVFVECEACHNQY